MSNTFKLLTDSTRFEAEVLDAIRASQRSIYAQFMTFEGDESGQRFAQLLLEKAQEGLDVRLMVDYYSDVVLSDVYPILLHRRGEVEEERQATHRLFAHLQRHGVQIQRTAPPGRFLKYMLYRNHKKMVVLDESSAFVGGINISDHNYAWHDFMVSIQGDLVADLVTDFCTTWNGKTQAFATPHPGEDFILNQCAGRYSIFEEILAMIGRAKESVIVQSPYLVGNYIEAALVAAAERGVCVKVIMPLNSNKLIYRIWLRKSKQNLDHPNITLYGYAGNDGMTHAKLVLVDDAWASFGSLNLMEVEGLTQKELNIFTSDRELIAQLKRFLAVDMDNSVRLTIPRYTFGRMVYNIPYRFFDWWTKRLLNDPDWVDLYC